MLKAKEAKELSKYECENLSFDILINDIDKYIIEACNKKRLKMYYMVDGTKYTYKTVKKAIKILKRSGYKVKKDISKPGIPNRPNHVELNIKW